MAKLFYSLDETCQKLGKSEDEVMALVESNQLSKFVDGDKLIFKVDQVDLLASGDDDDGGLGFADDEPAIGLETDDSGVLGFADDEPAAGEAKEQTGISIFDVDETEEADAAAQTQITSAPSFGMETHGDPAASGSGLLDMTREADDTSLGADLLEDFGAGDGEASTVGEGAEVGGGALFEDAGNPAAAQPAAVVYAEETISPLPSGLAGGACLGLAVAMALSFAVLVAIMTGGEAVFGDLLNQLSLLIAAGASAGLVVLGAIIGALAGKMAG
ncbi:MAG: hypothetical protein AAFX79_09690 [Planctomycetota bacterium]